VYKRVELVGHTKASEKSKVVLLSAAGVSMLFQRALAMFWCAMTEGWKQSNCMREKREGSKINNSGKTQ